MKRLEDDSTIAVHDAPLTGLNLMEFNCNGSLLATANKRNVLQVLDVRTMATVCTLDDCCSIAEVAWLQSGHQLAVFSELGLKTTLVDLATRRLVNLRNPKSTQGRNFALAKNHPFLAVLEREGKDFIRIYHTIELKLVNSIPLDSIDAGDIRWSPDDSTLVVCDCLATSRVLAVDPAFGVKATLDSPLASALATRTALFSEDSAYFICGGFDDRVRVVNKLIFALVGELELGPSALKQQGEVFLYREE